MIIPDRRDLLEHTLGEALEHDQLSVYYQPQVDLADGRIIGAEGLVRWIHPELGLISPAEFIPLAERIGLLSRIDNWVLEECCRQLAAWNQPNIRLSANLSTGQLHEAGFLAHLGQLLRVYAIPPGCLELELTEVIVIDDLETTARLLHQIRALGLRLAMDDFGTGLSTLSRLRELPFDVVKIDQSFVKNCLMNDKDPAIITAILSMSHLLGLKAVAEGIEEKGQLTFLKSLSCDYGQGYFFSRPIPADQFLSLLQEQPFLGSFS